MSAPRAYAGSLACQDLLNFTAAHFRVSLAELSGRSRRQDVSRARQVAMYLLCHDGGVTRSMVGTMLGRDHTTVLHGVRQVSESVREQGWAYKHVCEIRDVLNADILAEKLPEPPLPRIGPRLEEELSKALECLTDEFNAGRAGPAGLRAQAIAHVRQSLLLVRAGA